MVLLGELLLDFDPETGGWSLLDEGTHGDQERREVQLRKLVGFVAEHPGETRSGVVTGARVQKKSGLDLVRCLLDEGRLVEKATPGGGYGVFLP